MRRVVSHQTLGGERGAGAGVVVGDYVHVVVSNVEARGRVMFVGRTEFAGGEWIGVEMDDAGEFVWVDIWLWLFLS